jgi:serine/threonine protein kinase
MKVLKEPFSELEIASVMKCVFRGLEYLHSQQRIHRDIKAGMFCFIRGWEERERERKREREREISQSAHVIRN